MEFAINKDITIIIVQQIEYKLLCAFLLNLDFNLKLWCTLCDITISFYHYNNFKLQQFLP